MYSTFNPPPPEQRPADQLTSCSQHLKIPKEAALSMTFVEMTQADENRAKKKRELAHYHGTGPLTTQFGQLVGARSLAPKSDPMLGRREQEQVPKWLKK